MWWEQGEAGQVLDSGAYFKEAPKNSVVKKNNIFMQYL